MKIENRVIQDELYQTKAAKEKEETMNREAQKSASDAARRQEEVKRMRAEKRILMLERRINKRKTHSVMMHMIFQQIFEVADVKKNSVLIPRYATTIKKETTPSSLILNFGRI
jgi:hypothetical protein